MKSKIFLLQTVLTVLSTSCVSTFYQVYKAVPENNMEIRNGTIVYEDENVLVKYNLWGENGNIGFNLFNKTEKVVYLNLGHSYFVVNGVANDYYKNRVFTTTGSSGAFLLSYYFGIGATSSRDVSVAQKEEYIIRIPSLTSKYFFEYTITDRVHRHCDLFRFPTENQVNTVRFNKENSPLVFSNRLSYMIEDDETPYKFSNEFYVSEITNLPSDDVTEYKTTEFCGQKRKSTTRQIKDMSPDKFYIKYMREQTESNLDH